MACSKCGEPGHNARTCGATDHHATYYQRNRERIIASAKERYRLNPTPVKERVKRWRQDNPELVNRYARERHRLLKESNPEAAYKSHHISVWRSWNIVCDDWDALWSRYWNTSNCEVCGCELTTGTPRTGSTRCLDHDHDSNIVRHICCHACNMKLR